jgi:hypothetical protein
MKRRLEGEKPGGGRPLKNTDKLSEFWTYQKTADNLNISEIAVRRAIQIATAIEERPELANLQVTGLLKIPFW